MFSKTGQQFNLENHVLHNSIIGLKQKHFNQRYDLLSKISGRKKSLQYSNYQTRFLSSVLKYGRCNIADALSRVRASFIGQPQTPLRKHSSELTFACAYIKCLTPLKSPRIVKYIDVKEAEIPRLVHRENAISDVRVRKWVRAFKDALHTSRMRDEVDDHPSLMMT